MKRPENDKLLKIRLCDKQRHRREKLAKLNQLKKKTDENDTNSSAKKG